MTLPPENIEAVITPSEKMRLFITDLGKKARRFDTFGIEEYVHGLAEIMSNDASFKTQAMVAAVSRSILVGTVESMVIAKLRNLYLDTLAAQGYSIFENTEPQLRQRKIRDVCNEISRLYHQSHQENFDLGVAWINRMARTETERLLEEIGRGRDSK